MQNEDDVLVILAAFVLICIFQVYRLLKKGDKKEAAVYIAFTVFTLFFGIYVEFIKTQDQSLINALMELFDTTY